jgi:ribosomal protein L32
VDPYHAAIARNTIEWAGLTVARRKFQEEARAKQNPKRNQKKLKAASKVSKAASIGRSIRWHKMAKVQNSMHDDMDVQAEETSGISGL